MDKANEARLDSLSSAEKMTTKHVEREDVHSKDISGGHSDYHGINTSDVLPGADAAYEKKIALMNEALIDIGMGPFQWKIFFMTGFGWFVDNVCDGSLNQYPTIFGLTLPTVLDASNHHH